VSDDGRDALVVIAMLGAPFSPWYARDRGADPLGFAAFNVGLYGSRGRAWSLVETDRIDRAPEALRIGGSHIARDGSRITAVVDARRSYGRSIRGRVRVDALAWHSEDVALDARGVHAWRPLAPRARVQVEMAEPNARWSGWGYVDSNHGAEPLECALGRWTWSRAHVSNGATLVSYDAHTRGGAAKRVRRVFDSHGESSEIELATVPLPRTGWGWTREAHADPGRAARVVRTLEDTPFYARSLVETHVRGAPTLAMHESLSLERFAKPWVRLLLPFRIRREAGP
jgi:carotenoid 1,2-hydratase